MYRFIILFFLAMSVGGQIFAQDIQLFEYLPDKRTQLEEEALQKLESWEQKSLNDTISFIDLPNIATVHDNGVVKFTLPHFSDTIYATVNSVKQRKDSSLVWYGTIDCDAGSIMIISKYDKKYGYIVYKNNNYSIRTLEGDLTVLISQKLSNDEGGCTVTYQDTTSSSFSAYPHDVCCFSTILVLYTSNSAMQGSPQEIADIGVEDINHALANSEIGHRVEMVGCRKLEGFMESGNIALDRVNLKNNLTAQSLRDQHNADIVILLVEADVVDYGLGIAFLQEAGDSDFGYAIVNINSPDMRHTFAHEWAHLLSAVHEEGLVFGSENEYKTIMTPVPLDESRILHYSNPDVNYYGFSTGIDGVKNNAERITSLGCEVSRYRQNGEPCESFVISIDYELIYQDGASFHQFCAVAPECFARPDEVMWEYSYNGFDWQEAGDEMCLLIQEGIVPLRMVRLTYNCGDCTDIATYSLYIVCDQNFPEKSGQVFNGVLNVTGDIKVVPNPGRDFITITIGEKLVDSGVMNYHIVDVQGKEMVSGILNRTKISSSFEFDVHTFESGIYYLLISSEKIYHYEKFIVQK